MRPLVYHVIRWNVKKSYKATMTKQLILFPLILYVSGCLSNILWDTAETQVHGWYLAGELKEAALPKKIPTVSE